MSEKKIEKTYTHEDLTVVWKPHMCIHSENCWRGLSEVFNPKRRPWIDPTGAEKENIVTQIKQCPSGALSYQFLSESSTHTPMAETNSTRVEVLKDGPLCVHGKLTVVAADGSEVEKETKTFFCRCGNSQNKPFCDGTHRKTGFIG